MPWEVMPDLFFYRDPEDAEKEEQERQKALLDAAAAGQSKQLESVSRASWSNQLLTMTTKIVHFLRSAVKMFV